MGLEPGETTRGFVPILRLLRINPRGLLAPAPAAEE
jgi:hypothetical protein